MTLMVKKHAATIATMGFRVWEGHPTVMAATHQHHDIELNLVTSGAIEYRMGGREVRVDTGELVVFWAAIPHQLTRVADATAMAWAVFPLSWLRDWRGSEDLSRRLLCGEVLVMPQDAPRDQLDARRWNQMLQRDDERWQRVAALEIEARTRRLAIEGSEHWLATRDVGRGGRSGSATGQRPSTTTRPRTGTGTGTIAAPAEQMVHLLVERFREPLQVADVAATTGLNPTYAMRLFRREVGMTIIEFLTRQRVYEAQHLLVTTDRPVLDVAMDSGFGSISQFHTAFRRIVGTSPRAFRRGAPGIGV